MDFIRYSVIPPPSPCAAAYNTWYNLPSGGQTFCSCPGGCDCPSSSTGFLWIGLYFNRTQESWTWTDGSPLTFTNWNCNASSDIRDLSGQSRPYAVMSAGGALANQYSNVPTSSYTGLWSNTGFSAAGSISYGKYQDGGSKQACDPSVVPVDTTYGQPSYVPAGCSPTGSISYVCKVLA